jgi:F-type H+-transporting ATPase subunit delta
MADGSLARRYAKAFLEIAREDGHVDRLGQDLERFWRVCELEQGALAGALSNPVITHAERRTVLDRVLPGLALHHHTVNFLRLLLDKGRFVALGDILREYRALADEEFGRVRAVVTTAAPLDGHTRDAVAAALASATGKKVLVETRVDPSLLGGMVARVGSRVYDASLRSRLERLQLSLASTPQA